MTGTVTRPVGILMLVCGSCCCFSSWPCPKTGRATTNRVRTAMAVRVQSDRGCIILFIHDSSFCYRILLDGPTGIKSDEKFEPGGSARTPRQNTKIDVRMAHSRPLPDFFDLMSLEYAIEYPCEMRRLYGEQTLRALGRAGSLV